MPADVQKLRDDQPEDAPDAPGTPFSAWDYGHALARSGVAGLIGAGAYVVLHAVASHADKQANCQVGHACLARETGLSPTMVKHHLATLEACGALGIHRHRDDETKKWAVNRYHIQPLDAIHAAPATQQRKEVARSQAHHATQRGREVTAPTPREAIDPTPPREPNDPRGREVTAPTPREAIDPRVGNPTTPKATPLSYPDKHPSTVPPVDISKPVVDSARRARGGSPLSARELDPLEGWVQQAIGAIQVKREEASISPKTRALWARAIEETLGHVDQGERDAYMDYVLSDDYIPSRSSPAAVADAIRDDYPTWKRTGRPRTKDERRAGRARTGRVFSIPSAADIAAQPDPGPSCAECKKIPGAYHSPNCQFAGQIVGRERKTS